MATPPCHRCSRPSVSYCNCRTPVTSFCSNCSIFHKNTPGVHSWFEYQRAERANTTCQVCNKEAATVVCCCRYPITFLCCTECRDEHERKSGLTPHFYRSVAGSEKIKSLADIERANKVVNNKRRIEEYLDGNVAAAAKLKDEVTSLAENLVTQVNSAKEATLRKITDFQIAIEKKRIHLNEVTENHLFDTEVQSSDALIRAAFDTSQQFACTDVPQGELLRIGQIGPLLAQLHFPSILSGNPPEPHRAFQQPAARTEYVNQQYYGPQQVGISLPASVPAKPDDQSWQQYDQGAPDPAYYRCALQQCQQFLAGVQYVPAQATGMEYEQAPSTQVAPSESPMEWQLEHSNPFEITQERIDSVHASCRDNFQARTPEIPSTIGRHRLPIESLVDEYRGNEIMAWGLNQFPQVYSSWRRSRVDGNSFYRCTGVLLCEHYCRPGTQLAEFDAVYKRIYNQTPPFNILEATGDELRILKLWQRMLKNLYRTRKEGGNALQRLQYFLQRQLCDKALIIAMRQYTANYCHLYASDPSAFLAEGPDPLVRKILSDGKEAEGVAVTLTAKAFNLILYINTVDNTTGQITVATHGPSGSGWYPSMHLLLVSGHYSILIPRAWDDADGYKFMHNTYHPIAAQGAVDYEQYAGS